MLAEASRSDPDYYNLLTTKSVAEMLGLSERTIEKWRVQGCGPAHIKVGGLVRYRLSDVKQYIDENARASTQG